ncbi:hypothetical protein M0R45_029494 [Rubus argutus]|uniref:Uncharacterized protein n=1 Tax=Rubus argutus TaxID=59490 RepID=A0AAW1W7V0_RUBAR
MENSHSKPHAMILPFLLQGHVNPAVQLAIQLTVTFVNTQAVHHQIVESQSPNTTIEDVNIFDELRKSSLDIRYETISDGFPVRFDRSLNLDQFREALYYHLNLLRENGHFASDGNHRQDAIHYVPGVKAIKPIDLTSYLQATEVTSTIHKIICKAFDEVKRADFILCNTIQELESETISALPRKATYICNWPCIP